jgi:hypothetical protein
MKSGTLLSVVLALAVGGGVGWWIRRSSAGGTAEDAGVTDAGHEGEAPRRDGDAAGAPAVSPGESPSPGAPETGATPGAGAPGGRPAPPDAPPKMLIVTPADLPPPDEPEPGPPKYLVAGHEEALKAVDWKAVGRSLSQLTPLAAQFAERVTKTGVPPPEVAARFAELNAPLLMAAVKVREKTGVTNPNSAFTHPASMANAIHATLEAAGKPLTDAQGARVLEFARLYTDREKARLDAYAPHAYALEKLIEECALRDDFFAAVNDTLTPEQRTVLWPAGSKGRLNLDFFSSSLVWSAVTRPLWFKEKDGLVTELTDLLVQSLLIPEDRRPVVRAAAAEYVSSFPAGTPDASPDALTKHGMMQVSTVIDGAKRWLLMLRRIVQQGRLDEETMQRIRGGQSVLIPLRLE